jgi:hypothetical protein
MSAPDETPANPLPQQATFSAELRELAARFAEHPVCLADILEATKGRGFHLILFFISLPFTTPIPTPGISMPFGAVISLIGARMALGQRPWLPQKLLLRQLPPGFLAKLLGAAGRIMKFLERFLRPRLEFLHAQLIYRSLAGALIAVSGLYMMLPLPFPFTNGLPASTVLLLSAAALARDGVFFIAGCVMFAVTTGFFMLLAMGGAQAIEQLRRFFTGG